MWWRGVVLSLGLLPLAASADVLTFEIRPSADLTKNMSCRIELRDGLIIAVAINGVGMPPRHAMRWPVRRGEAAAIGDALAAFIAGDLPSVEIHTSHGPPPPYVSVIWSTQVSGVRMSGQYFQSGLDLPPPLARAIDAVIPGSICQGATN